MLTAATSENILILALTGGDRQKFKEALSKWKFKDEQSMMRFVVSVLLLNEDEYFRLKMHGKIFFIEPSDGMSNA